MKPRCGFWKGDSRRFWLAAVVAATLGCSGSASAQSANIDLDVGIGDGTVGNGAPSPGFGAAAGMAGVWNRINAGGPRQPVSLLGLDGTVLNAQMQATGGFGRGGAITTTTSPGTTLFS